MYADVITDSMRRAIDETNRRRKIQQEYNRTHGITPKTIKKAVRELIAITKAVSDIGTNLEKDIESMNEKELRKGLEKLKKEMHRAAAELNFEEAARLRDEMIKWQQALREL